jgi:RNA polymerase sigma-70 factor (ECF subfamily)
MSVSRETLSDADGLTPVRPPNRKVRNVMFPIALLERELNTTDSVMLDDDVLLRRVASGDEREALEELYRRYERRVYEFGLRVLGDRELAGELVQEGFLRLWRTADRFDHSRGTVAAYLFTLARSVAVDLWRRPSSRPFEPEGAEAGEVAAACDVTDAMLTRLVIDQAMDSLSLPHREVLVLSYWRDLTQPAVAIVLGIPLGTVKTRSYYALRALKLALAERGVHDHHAPGSAP